jgi:putative transposase
LPPTKYQQPNRGVKDIFIACVDGLTGFPAAIETVFPKNQIQLCIVHMVRNSLNYVSWKHRKSVAADLQKIYTALNAEAAERALVDFAENWDNLYPTISKSWLTHWQHVIPFFAFPLDIRKAIYTTNAIESMNDDCVRSYAIIVLFPPMIRLSRSFSW